jgi:hypothetical protein
MTDNVPNSFSILNVSTTAVIFTPPTVFFYNSNRLPRQTLKATPQQE